MDDVKFFAKMLGLTLAVVFILQIKIGKESLDEKVSAFVESSIATSTLQEVANGGVRLAQDAYNKLAGSIHSSTTKEKGQVSKRSLPKIKHTSDEESIDE